MGVEIVIGEKARSDMKCVSCTASTGPWFYGTPGDGPFCASCWKAYFEVHADALTLRSGGVQMLFKRRG